MILAQPRRREARIVLHTSEPASGAASYVSRLAISLAARREVTVLCPSNFEMIQPVREAGINAACCRDVPPPDFRRNLSAKFQAIAHGIRFSASLLLRQLRSLRRGDIVHIQFPQPFPSGLAPFVLARLMGSKIVFTAHDPVPRKWRAPGRRAHLERISMAWAYRVSHRIIVHNKSGAQFLKNEFGLNPSKITVIPHGACHVFATTEPFPKFDALRILCFGSIRENKGLHTAIEAVQRLNRGYGRRVRLTIAGNVPDAGEREYWQRCKRLIQSQPEGIWVIDRYIAEREAGPLFAEHHAVLLPYQTFWSESGAASRALSNGRPILATQSEGLGSLLAESGGGVAIEGHSAGAIARALQNAFLAGADQLEQMGAKGRQFMLAQRSWDAIARDTEAVYDSLREMKPQALGTLAGAARGGD